VPAEKRAVPFPFAVIGLSALCYDHRCGGGQLTRNGLFFVFILCAKAVRGTGADSDALGSMVPARSGLVGSSLAGSLGRRLGGKGGGISGFGGGGLGVDHLGGCGLGCYAI
jgi:hypothetical protein